MKCSMNVFRIEPNQVFLFCLWFNELVNGKNISNRARWILYVSDLKSEDNDFHFKVPN
jgi:hypothetical protein